MKFVKKELLLVPPDIKPEAWASSDSFEKSTLCVTAGMHRYQNSRIFTATFYDKECAPYARLYAVKNKYITYLYDREEWTIARLGDISAAGNSSWPYLNSGHCAIYDEKTKQAIQKITGGQHGTTSSLDYLQHKIKMAQQNKRWDAHLKNANRFNVAKAEPSPPEDLISWLTSKGFADVEYMFFRSAWFYNPLEERKYRSIKGYCTSCRQEMELDLFMPSSAPDTAEEVRHNNIIFCPECGSITICKAWAKSRSGEEQKAKVLVFNKRGKAALAIGYEVSRFITREGSDTYHVQPMNAYAFTSAGALRYAKWINQGMMGGICILDEWDYRERIMDFGWDYTYPLTYEILEGTCLENSMVVDYVYQNQNKNSYSPMKYCEQYLRYPGIENLQRCGQHSIISEKLHGSKEVNRAIKWREFSPRKMLGLNKDELYRASTEEWNAKVLMEYKQNKQSGWVMSADELAVYRATWDYDLRELPIPAGSLKKVYRYFIKQRNRNEGTYGSLVITWRDYILAGHAIGYNFDDPAVLLPPNLAEAHNRAISARKYVEDPALIEKFKDMHKRLAPLTWEHGELLIRPAASEKELIIEGTVLSHCVGGYGESHCAGRPIFFIREKSQPDTPYYTLQLDIKQKQIMQNRGFHNNDYGYPEKPDYIDEFANLWLKHVVTPYNFETGEFKHKTKTWPAA